MDRYGENNFRHISKQIFQGLRTEVQCKNRWKKASLHYFFLSRVQLLVRSGLPVIGARLRPEGYASGNVMRARSLIDEPTSSVEKRKTKGLFDGPRQKPQQREQSILLISKKII